MPARERQRERQQFDRAYSALRIGLGAMFVLTGADKFAGLLTNWSMYLSPAVEKLSPLSGDALLRVVGVAEIVLGLVILGSASRVAAGIAAAWLAAIVANLVVAHFLDLALRDAVVALGAFALAELAGARRVAALPDRATGEPPGSSDRRDSEWKSAGAA
jgi:uncharacterized membrane protein YphA (DoxX/SURF4 family)